MIEVELKEWGNSIGIILPNKRLRKLNLKKGDKIEIEIITKKMVDGFGIAGKAKPLDEEDQEHKEFF